ncbi:hypothetical protein EMCRGX_G004172 [Ephydatia muelleri]
MRTQFMCSVNNEAVLKALFKHKEGDLTFAKAVAVAVETEEAAKVAKETVHGVVSIPIHKVEASTRRGVHHHQDQDHTASLRFTEAVISLWDLPTLRKNGPQKRGRIQQVKPISKHRIQTVKASETVPQLQQPICIQDKEFVFEVNTGAGDNFCFGDIWKKAGEPALSPVTGRYEVVNGQLLPTLGMFETIVLLPGDMSPKKSLHCMVTKVPQLNLLGHDDIGQWLDHTNATLQASLGPFFVEGYEYGRTWLVSKIQLFVSDHLDNSSVLGEEGLLAGRIVIADSALASMKTLEAALRARGLCFLSDILKSWSAGDKRKPPVRGSHLVLESVFDDNYKIFALA